MVNGARPKLCALAVTIGRPAPPDGWELGIVSRV